tara:strand:+ start:865 stop:1185 length:321 start_codon:yes stop_codon:yes gene_type:complete
MPEKSEPRPEIKVVVESKDTASKVILIALVIVLSGVLMALLTTEAGENILGSATDSSGNCGDGIDNDNGGQADEDDPDCYNNPELWEGYDEDRSEANRDNDPPGGR